MTPYPPLLRAVAAHGLAGSDLSLPSAPLDDAAWRRLLAGVARQRLAGLLAQAVADGALPVTDAQLAQAIEAHQAAMGTVLRLDRQLQRTSQALADAGITHRALKGAGFAHLDYPDPGQRCYGDVDLLVASAELDRAVDALLAADHARAHPPVRQGFDARFAKTVELRDSFEVDLHRTLVLEPFGWWIHEPDLFADPAPVDIGGHTVWAPPRTVRFLHACYHATLGNRPVRLAPLRDLAQIASHPGFDWRAAVTLAGRWRGQAVLAHAVGTAAEAFEIDRDGGVWRWARSHVPAASERRVLDGYLHGTRRQTERALDAIRALPRWSDRAAYLSALLRPDPAHLAARGLSTSGWWSRGARSLKRTLGRSADRHRRGELR